GLQCCRTAFHEIYKHLLLRLSPLNACRYAVHPPSSTLVSSPLEQFVAEDLYGFRDVASTNVDDALEEHKVIGANGWQGLREDRYGRLDDCLPGVAETWVVCRALRERPMQCEKGFVENVVEKKSSKARFLRSIDSSCVAEEA